MATGLSMDNLAYVGMVGIIDPERPQVVEAVSQLKTGGVIVKMITGDAEKTAKAIGKIKLFYNLIEFFSIILASRLKIYNANDLSLSGEDLDHMSTTELDTAIAKATVFYRVSPKHKLTIVKVNFSKKIFIFQSKFSLQTLQAQGHIVGMTGDGVNDAVALKAADIGIAMGQTGTDVCKEAADMILVKENFD